MKQVHGEEKVLRVEELIGSVKEVRGVRPGRAFERRRGRGHLARLDYRFTDCRDLQKYIVAQDGIIALEDILVIRVPPVALFVRIVVAKGMALAVAIPLREADPPAIFERDKMVLFLLVAWQDAGGAG